MLTKNTVGNMATHPERVLHMSLSYEEKTCHSEALRNETLAATSDNGSSGTLRTHMNAVKPPEVSVVMTSYNYAHFIAAAIESVVAQSLSSWELIIVDDGSTDSSPDIIRRYAEEDARIFFFQHPHEENCGIAASLRLGLEHVRGQYVAFLESDDMWSADCLEKRLARLRTSGADVVFNHIEILGGAKGGKHPDTFFVEKIRDRFMAYPPVFQLRATLLGGNVIPTLSCAMLKTEGITQIDFAVPVKRWLDWWLWLQIAASGSFTYLDAPCTLWRRHEASYNHKRTVRGYFNDSKAMWNAMRNLVPQWYRGKLRVFLNLPFPFYLPFRFLHIARTNGSTGMMWRMLSKLRSATGEHGKMA
jgi:glycosyltransferase involved in cell wall biosynthesis